MIASIEKPEKILVIRLSSIGDIILTTPLLRALKRAFPDAGIDFVVKSRFRELLVGNPNIERIIPFDDEKSYSELRRIRQQILEKKYDWLIDIHKNLRSLFLRSGSGARHLFRYNKHRIRRFLLIQFKWDRYPKIAPVFKRYMQELIAVGVEDDDRGPELFVDPAASERVNSDFGAFFDAHDCIIGLVPGASYATKRWLPDRFAEVGKRFVEAHHAGVVLFGSSSERALNEEIMLSIGSRNALSLAGKTSLQESMAAMAKCNLVISNDSGFMHVAEALKKKLVALFGATTAQLGFFPVGENCIVVQNEDLGCRPCTHIGSQRCPKKHFKCMQEISVEEVYAAAVGLLEGSA
ncbi:lipopolysaccharide heptosyltransferase II [candidate division KSB1 bacterium]|nr:lipopolysaccharide heptosyltransferase II [candidate division KSB1 bacterium]